MRMLNPSDWSRRSLTSDLMADVFDDFDRIVNALATRPNYANVVGFQPRCDISETKDHYLVSFDMPGVKKEDIKLEVQDNQLVISGERNREIREGDGKTTLRHERVYGKFERAFTLPTSIDADKIEAHYEDGVLNVVLPKAEVAKGRTIQIQTGQNGFFSKLLSAKKETKEVKDSKLN
jgi:HSP20 family protein